MEGPNLEGTDIALVFNELAPRSPASAWELRRACREVGIKPVTVYQVTVFLIRQGVIGLDSSEAQTRLQLTDKGKQVFQKVGSLTVAELIPGQYNI